MKGEQAKGKFMDKVAFGSFNKPFKKKDTTLPGFRATSIRSKSTATTNNADTSCPTTSINAL